MTTPRQEGVQPGDDVRGEPRMVETPEEAGVAETAEDGAEAIVKETAATTGEAVTQAVEGQEAVKAVEEIDEETGVPMRLLKQAFQDRLTLRDHTYKDDRIIKATGVTLKIVGSGATAPTAAGTGIPKELLRQEYYRRLNLMLEEAIPAAETSFKVDRDPDYRKDRHGHIRQNAPDDLANYFESWLVFGGKLAHAAAGKVIGKLIEKEKGLTREQRFPDHRQAFIRAIVEMLGESRFKDPYNAFEVLKDIIDTLGPEYAKEILSQKTRTAKLPESDKILAYARAKLDGGRQ